MKKTVTLLIAMIMLFSLTACSEKEVPVAETQTPETVGVTEPAEVGFVDVSASWTHVAALRSDGTVAVVIEEGRDKGQGDTASWTDIVAVSTGYSHTVGLRSDGTCVAVGLNEDGQCEVSEWRDIVAISAGDYFTVGLKADGTVVATGNNDKRQCETSELKNIVEIAATAYSLQCIDDEGNWLIIGGGRRHGSNGQNLGVVSLGASDFHSVGLKADGTAFFISRNDHTLGHPDISEWNDLSQVSAGIAHVMGLRTDGTVYVAGRNNLCCKWLFCRCKTGRDPCCSRKILEF